MAIFCNPRVKTRIGVDKLVGHLLCCDFGIFGMDNNVHVLKCPSRTRLTAAPPITAYSMSNPRGRFFSLAKVCTVPDCKNARITIFCSRYPCLLKNPSTLVAKYSPNEYPPVKCRHLPHGSTGFLGQVPSFLRLLSPYRFSQSPRGVQ